MRESTFTLYKLNKMEIFKDSLLFTAIFVFFVAALIGLFVWILFKLGINFSEKEKLFRKIKRGAIKHEACLSSKTMATLFIKKGDETLLWRLILGNSGWLKDKKIINQSDMASIMILAGYEGNLYYSNGVLCSIHTYNHAGYITEIRYFYNEGNLRSVYTYDEFGQYISFVYY